MSDAMAVTDRSPTGSGHIYTEALSATREDEEAHASKVLAGSEQEGE